MKIKNTKLKDRVFTDEHKRKIGLKHKNKVLSLETKRFIASTKLKHGKYSKYFPKEKPRCPICNMMMGYNSKRCKICSPKSRATIKRFEVFCIDCNKLLSKNACYYDYKRCNKCTKKGKPSFQKGKKKPEFSGNKHPRWKPELHINKFCKVCNKQLCETNKFGFCNNHKNMKGKNNPNWKNGVSPLNDLIKNLEQYINWRKLVFTRDNYTCQECYQKSKGNIESHHIKSFSIIFSEFLSTYSQFSPIEDKETLVRLAESYEPFWNIDNGITLCKDCHDKKGLHLNKLVRLPTVKTEFSLSARRGLL
jgi:5-methylcytosine-specific restriction endonuclease McrA